MVTLGDSFRDNTKKLRDIKKQQKVMKIIVETEELKQEILKQSEYIHDFIINKDDVKGLGKDWIIGLDSDKAGILMHLYMAPQIIEVKQ